MKKKNKTQNIEKKDVIVDMSSRRNLNIVDECEYTEEELNSLIVELKKQMDQMEDFYQRYYSLNAYIERINKRNFFNILYAKIISIISKLTSSMLLKK